MNRTLLAAVLLCPAQVLAFQLKEAPSGQAVRWSTPVKVEVALGDGPVAQADAFAAVKRAAATWTAALPGQPGNLAVVAAESQAVTSPGDGRNTVRWATSDWNDDYGEELIAVTQLSYGAVTGRIYDADILLNAKEFEFTTDMDGCAGAYDLESVLDHELGHLLGMAHENGDATATMYPSMAPCQIQKRHLAADDLAGVRTLYAVSAAPAAAQPAAPAAPVAAAPAAVSGEPKPISQNPLGCAVAPGTGTGSSGLAALMLVLATCLLARRRFALAAAASLALMSSAALASTSKALTMAELGARADVIAHGTVVASHVHQIGDRIYTDVEIQTAALWKGHAGALVTVRQLGGELDGRVLEIEGQPVLAVGDEVVVFVRASHDGAFRLVGMSQGAFRLVHAGGSAYALRDESGLLLVGPHGLRPGGLESYALATLHAATSSPAAAR